MQAAKDAVKKFTNKDGHHDTTVHETVNPAVTNETVHQQQEQRIHRAVDKEVHQDHYHTSVQPVHDKHVMAEQHHHRAGEVEHRNFEHGDHQVSKDRHAREAAVFQDQSKTVQGESTRTVQPTVGAEHVHHHVHEQIQPVVHKQTIEPHVVHTTQPVHETHHNEAKHHQTSTLPAVGIDDFKHGGGSLTGRAERVDGFEGCPKGVHESGATSGRTGTTSTTGTTGTHHHHHGADHSHATGTSAGGLPGSNTSSGLTGSNTFSGLTGSNTSSGLSGSNNSSGLTGSNNSSGLTGSNTSSGATGTTGAVGGSGVGGSSAQTSTNQHQKPSMMDKLNPMKDSDGDGVKGFMK